MAKKQSSTKSETQSQGTCRNIFRAFRRRVSLAGPRATQSPISANRADHKVLVEYNHSNNAEPMKPGPVSIQHEGPKGVKFQRGYSKSNNTGGASDEKFNDFIAQVKKKIKANSSFAADENGPRAGATRRDSFNDRISHFINRAKLKMRSTTTVADENGPRSGATRRDSFNDRISHFINRAKLKMRSTTIAAADQGDGKLQTYTPR